MRRSPARRSSGARSRTSRLAARYPSDSRYLLTPSDAGRKSSDAISVVVLPFRITRDFAKRKNVDLDRAYDRLVRLLNVDPNVRIINPRQLEGHALFDRPPAIVGAAQANELRKRFGADLVVVGKFHNYPATRSTVKAGRRIKTQYDKLEVRVDAWLTAQFLSYTARRGAAADDYDKVDVRMELTRVFEEIRGKVGRQAVAKIRKRKLPNASREAPSQEVMQIRPVLAVVLPMQIDPRLIERGFNPDVFRLRVKLLVALRDDPNLKLLDETKSMLKHLGVQQVANRRSFRQEELDTIRERSGAELVIAPSIEAEQLGDEEVTYRITAIITSTMLGSLNTRSTLASLPADVRAVKEQAGKAFIRIRKDIASKIVPRFNETLYASPDR